jgi:NADH:ubiquinone oxidoreductase subunit 6 (subunit J)
MEFAFYICGLIAILATLRVITHTNPVHALLYLIISLLAIAGVFFSLGAHFAGALEIIVYAGAIMVLFVFVVMMLNLGGSEIEQERQWLKPQVWIGPAILSAICWWLSFTPFWALTIRVSTARRSALKKSVLRCLGRTFWRWSWPPCCCWRVWLLPSTLAAKSVPARC